jgi:hypothetical protein
LAAAALIAAGKSTIAMFPPVGVYGMAVGAIEASAWVLARAPAWGDGRGLRRRCRRGLWRGHWRGRWPWAPEEVPARALACVPAWALAWGAGVCVGVDALLVRNGDGDKIRAHKKKGTKHQQQQQHNKHTQQRCTPTEAPKQPNLCCPLLPLRVLVC